MNSTFQPTFGTRQISDQRIEADPLAKTIVSMINAMKADYGRIFTKQFFDEETLTNFKRRLYQKLKGLEIEAVVEGYELCIERNTKFCPTVPEIVAAVLETIKRHQKRDENKAEADRVSALPAPTISCNPLELLDQAKSAGRSGVAETSDERMARRAELLKNHESLLVLNGHRIKRVYADVEHLCAHHGCGMPGGIGSGITGKSNFYCADHYRMA